MVALITALACPVEQVSGVQALTLTFSCKELLTHGIVRGV